MHWVEVHNGINQIINFFRHIALWDVEDANTCRKKIKFIQLFCYLSYPMALGAGAYMSTDTDESVFLAAFAMAAVVHVYRLFYFIRRRSEILMYIREIGSFVAEDQDEFSRINKKLDNFMKFSKYLLTLIIISLMSILCTSAIRKELHLNIGFGLDYKNGGIGYWMAFAYFSIELIYAASMISITIIIWYLLLSFAIKYQLLGNQLKRMGTTGTGTTKKPISEKNYFFHQGLVATIERHRQLRK